MIIGTAGHIDHGKTALVQALTGVDTDRLPEEKRRGITIELGFAPLEIEGFGTLGVVDVPGHEAFVRTMLAGATGIDVALLVVAADEGVMPQTREHLDILQLLGVRHGVVAVTKCDLVDEEWRALVEDEVRSLLRGGVLEGAPLCFVSVKTGTGLPELRSLLQAVASEASESLEDDGDLFRMPVDRVFSLRGTGTVVTGTVWSGALRRGVARVYPPGRAVRVRDLHSHGRRLEAVDKGMRAAAALADLGVDDVSRGSVLVAGGDWLPTSVLRTTFTPLETGGVRPGARSRVRLHIGSAEIGARLVPLAPGQVRVHLDEPILCRSGDRFIVRGGPRLTTLGGGIVLDPYSRSRARALPVSGADPAQLIVAFTREAGSAGVAIHSLPVRAGVSPARLTVLLESLPLHVTGARAYSPAVLPAARARVEALVDARHRDEPLAPGATLDEARAAAGVPHDLFERLVAELGGAVRVSGAHLHRAGWVPRLDAEQSALAERMLHAFCSSAEPTTEAQVAERFGPASLPVLRHLEREGGVVRLGETLVAAQAVIGAMVERLRGHMAPGRGYSPAELRDALGVSRKVLIPLLEYCDRLQVTERHGSERVLSGWKPSSG